MTFWTYMSEHSCDAAAIVAVSCLGVCWIISALKGKGNP